MNRGRALALIFVTYVFVSSLGAQQTTRHPGILLYEQGKYDEAISELEQAKKQKEYIANPEIWSFLGRAYLQKGNLRKARKPLEKAVELDPANSTYRVNLAYLYLLSRQIDKARSETEKVLKTDPGNVTAYYLRGTANMWENKLDSAEKDADKTIALDPSYPQGYILKSEILVTRLGVKVTAGSSVQNEIGLLKSALDTLNAGVSKSKNSPNHALIEDTLESIGAFYAFFIKDKTTQITTDQPPEPGVTPLKILRKSPLGYTDSARSANVQGTITVAVLFGADGKIRHTLLLKRLGNGLDEQAVSVARKITFEPRMKDGKPVSTVRIVEYTFSIH